MDGPSQELERPQEGPPDDTPRWCTVESCRRRPFFGLMGGKPMFCQQHSKKSEGMVDVSSRRCEAVGCAKWPLYGNEGQKAKFCSLHKGPSMIDVRSRRCAESGCKRQPSYGFEGKRACFCAAHKAEGMVDVVSRRCEYPNCRRRPLYGFEGKKSQFCSAHKQEGQVDVCNRRCQFPGCSKRPCFGLPGQRPSFCGTHRDSEMVDVISHKCGYPGCSHPAGYEANRVRSKFCDKHKSVGLAGASLLQLAISASGDGSARAPPAPAKGTTPPKSRNISKNPQSSTSESRGVDKARRDVHPQGERSGAGESSSDTCSRHGSFAAPLYSSSPTKAVVTTAKVESAESSPPFPSLNGPRSHLKRPLEVQVAVEGHGTNVSEAAAVLSSCTMDSSSSSSSSQPPNTPTGGVPVGRSGGAARFKVVHSDTDGQARAQNAMNEDKASCDVSAVAADADADTAPAKNRPPARAKRLFSGPRRESPAWKTPREEWNPKVGPETGFVASSPSPDWRKIGLESLGRTASLDEARAAALRQGLDAGNDGRPRRASAFVVHGSSLPPVVTEMGRRCSAVETRAAPIRVPHYSDLLSAKAPFRSVTAYSDGAERYRPSAGMEGSPRAWFEGQHDNELNNGYGYAQRAGALPSIQSLTASSQHGAGQVRPLEDSASDLRFSASVAPAKRMFHVIPVASAYMARSAFPSIEQGGASPTRDSLPSEFGWPHERFSGHNGSSPSLHAVAGSRLPRSGTAGDHSKLDSPPCVPYRGQRRFSVLGEGSFAEDGESGKFGPAREGVVERKGDSPSTGRSTRRRNSMAPAHDGEKILASSDSSHFRPSWSLSEKDASQSGSPVRSRGTPYGRDSSREPSTFDKQKRSDCSGATSRGSRPAKILFGGTKKEGDVLTSSTTTPAATSSLSSPITKEKPRSSPSPRRWSVLERPSSSSSKHLGMPPSQPSYAWAWGATPEDNRTVEEEAARDSIARHGIGARITPGSGAARRGPLMPAAFEAMEPPMGPMMSRNPFVAPSVLTPAREHKEALEAARAVQLRRHSFLGVNSRSDGTFLSPHKASD